MIKNIYINKIFIILAVVVFVNNALAETSFKTLEGKKTSYLDFFLLKFENRIFKRSLILKRQMVPTRVQYSNIGTQVELNKNDNKILVKIYAIMDQVRYSKKKYSPKLRDCNQIRNLIFYQKHGYKFFSQKRDPNFSKAVMEDIFKEVFFNNTSLDKKEIHFLMNSIYVDITIFHPIKKIELNCSGKANDYELR